jgi:CBS domain-containing protein
MAAGPSGKEGLTMTIEGIRTREVVTVGRDTSAAEAARLMRYGHVGDVVVVDELDGRRIPCGIVTDRDMVVSVVAKGLNPEMISVGEIMAPELAVGKERDSIARSIDVMREKGIRRLPIVDARGDLVGIVSIDDLFAFLAMEIASLARVSGRERHVEAQLRR